MLQIMNKLCCEESMIKSLLSMLKVDRLLDHFWVNIGKVLYNTYKNIDIDQGFKIWLEFTESSIGKYDTNTYNMYKEIYSTFANNNYLTYKTLAFYAREDSPIKFEKWHTQWITEALIKCTSFDYSDITDIVEAFYRCYFLEFIGGSDVDPNNIYQFIDNRWKKENNKSILLDYISNNFILKITEFVTSLEQKINENISFGESVSLGIKIRQFNKLIDKLKCKNYCKDILLESFGKFYVDRLVERFDSDPNLIQMKNGVIEITKHTVIFRPVKPEVFLLKSQELNGTKT